MPVVGAARCHVEQERVGGRLGDREQAEARDEGQEQRARVEVGVAGALGEEELHAVDVLYHARRVLRRSGSGRSVGA